MSDPEVISFLQSMCKRVELVECFVPSEREGKTALRYVP